MTKTVVITQSNYLPWLGYFDLLRSADEVVLLDSVQYTRRDWRNRNLIKTHQGSAWLTIPVEAKGRYLQAIDETHIADPTWAKRHCRAIELAYRHAASYAQVAPWLFGLLDSLAAEQSLSTVNERTIRGICDRLGIHVKIHRCTNILPRGTLRNLEANERLIAIAKQLEATRYLSGPSAQTYLSIDRFHAEGIEVVWMDYQGYPPYPQLWDGFTQRVSVVDLLLEYRLRGAPLPDKVHEMKLSIVATLYRSAATIDEFYRRAMAVGKVVTADVELILVNDGSPDDSLDRALALQVTDPRVVVVDLARNAAHHKAMMVGLTYARGDLVFLLDSDLEEEPELLTRFHERLRVGDCDVVYGVQEQRRGGLIARLPGELYFLLLDWLSDEGIPRNLLTARLMTRDYVRALVRHRDREFVMSHLWAATGFRQVAMPVRKLSLSKSTYSFRRRVELAIKHVTTTSTKLLYLIFYAGLMVSFWSAATIVYFTSRYMFVGVGTDGWTSLIVSVWFFGGLTTLILGIIGIYVANVLSESKRRPYAVIRHVYRAVEPAEQAPSNLIRTSMGSSRTESSRTR